MFHAKRTFGTVLYSSAADLAFKLNTDNANWTLCTGMQFGNILLVNDSFEEGSLQEYAVLEIVDATPDTMGRVLVRQIESFTVSWMSALKMYDSLLALAEEAEHWTGVRLGKELKVAVDYSPTHRCELCM